MHRSLLKRVEQLENDPRFQPPPPPSAADRLFREKSQELLRAIDKRYARLIGEDLQRNPLQPHGWSGLRVEFLVRVVGHVCEERPLAFPAAVAAAYLGNPYAGHGAACNQCGYKLPWGYFKLCPVCGGQVTS